MKTTLLLLTLTASLVLADTTSQRVAIKPITSVALDTVFDQIRAGGIRTQTRVATTNLASLFISQRSAATTNRYPIRINFVPLVVCATNISTNGLMVISKQVTTFPSETIWADPPMMQFMFNAGIGVAGDISPKPSIYNFQYVSVLPVTNTADWQITIPMK
jgi:hypothetical protein